MESLKPRASQAESDMTSVTTTEIAKSWTVGFQCGVKDAFSDTDSLGAIGPPSRGLIIVNANIRMNHSKPNIDARTSDKYQSGFWYPSKIRFIPNRNSATATVAAATTSQ
jgi:hypothetical protein